MHSTHRWSPTAASGGLILRRSFDASQADCAAALGVQAVMDKTTHLLDKALWNVGGSRTDSGIDH